MVSTNCISPSPWAHSSTPFPVASVGTTALCSAPLHFHLLPFQKLVLHTLSIGPKALSETRAQARSSQAVHGGILARSWPSSAETSGTSRACRAGRHIQKGNLRKSLRASASKRWARLRGRYLEQHSVYIWGFFNFYFIRKEPIFFQNPSPHLEK